jgi:predicted transcriptional regulator of viral defense system
MASGSDAALDVAAGAADTLEALKAAERKWTQARYNWAKRQSVPPELKHLGFVGEAAEAEIEARCTKAKARSEGKGGPSPLPPKIPKLPLSFGRNLG